MKVLLALQGLPDKARNIDFIAPLALRLYLVPVFWMAGTTKWASMDSTIAWFGNPEWGLGLPFPAMLAYAATLSEVVGAVLLLVGFAVRWVSIPLMITMAVAAFTVHWENGWPAIAEAGTEAAQRLNGFLDWLSQEYPGRYEYITELGRPVALNNGIEFAATYFVMLLSLFFIGGGKYVSLDYWLHRYIWRHHVDQETIGHQAV